MVRAWYIEGDGLVNPRDEHQKLPPKFITLEDLYNIAGVQYFTLNLESCENDGTLDKIKEDTGCFYVEEFVTPSENDLQQFHYREHLHENDEIRLVLEGSGYYDVRDKKDDWIRIEVVAGDLIVIPTGCYHRFMLDHSNSFRAKRLFAEAPGNQYFYRPVDDMECRQAYIKKVQN